MTDRQGHIYVMRRADGIRKVGFAINLKRRHSQIKAFHGPMEIEIYWVMSERATWFVEGRVHSILAPLRHSEGLSQELYDLPLRTIVAAVRTAKSWTRQWMPDGHMGTAAATKRLGFATKAGYLRRLAAAEKWLSQQPKETTDVTDEN